MVDLLVTGGWVMPLIVVCSVIALTICIERFTALDRVKVAPPHLLATVWRDLNQGELYAQKLVQLRANSPLGAILAAGIANREQGREVMKESIAEAASHVVHDLEKNLNTLGHCCGNSTAPRSFGDCGWHDRRIYSNYDCRDG